MQAKAETLYGISANGEGEAEYYGVWPVHSGKDAYLGEARKQKEVVGLGSHGCLPGPTDLASFHEGPPGSSTDNVSACDSLGE